MQKLLKSGLAGFLIGIATTANAQTEVARTPWQVTGSNVCAEGRCRVYFPQIGAKQRLEVLFVSCSLSTFGDQAVHYATLGVNNAFSSPVHTLVWNDRKVLGTLYPDLTIHEISQPVVFRIPAGSRPQLGWDYNPPDTNANVARCSISGDLVFLQ